MFSVLDIVRSDIVNKLTMDSLFMQNTSEELDDIPQTHEPVWILGKKYNAMKGFIVNEFIFQLTKFRNYGK